MNASNLSRWRGFNLLEKFTLNRNTPFLERDFQWISDWGFDFVRLPMDYRCWSEPDDWTKFREDMLKELDEAIDFGSSYGIHVNLNFHRAPGYCVNPPEEPLNLWTNDEALNVCAEHWALFANRYKGIPNEKLSFDLLNEPSGSIPEESYVRIVRRLVEAIREEDPDRLIIADGFRWGRDPVFEIADLGIAQSTRGYDPMDISHYKASWIGRSDWHEPAWPLTEGDETWDKDRLQRERIDPWKELEAEGVGVHVGEWGAFNKTPHQVVLAWMQDCLDLWNEAGWGWALWNFRGSFGIIDSNRQDVSYEDWHGHKLDRAMLELLQSY